MILFSAAIAALLRLLALYTALGSRSRGPSSFTSSFVGRIISVRGLEVSGQGLQSAKERRMYASGGWLSISHCTARTELSSF